MGTIGTYTKYNFDADDATFRATLKEPEPSKTSTPTTTSTPVPPPPPLQPIRTAGGDLSFTNAGYGGAIPLVFGADKVTGTVIWASPITTNQVPVNNQYVQYQSVDFALALCEGPIEGILRIWLGDRLIYDTTMQVDGSNAPSADANGVVDTRTIDITDPNSPLSTLPLGDRNTRLTLFSGSETQLPYGVMVDVEGVANTPAYRGIAYILFENFVTAGTDTPTIVVEVSSNTAGFFPRVAATPQGSSLTSVEGDALYVNEAWGQVFYHSEGAGSGSSQDEGLIGINMNTWEEESNVEYENTYFGGANLIYNKGVVTALGNMIIHSGGANPGTVRSINGLAGVGIDSLGPNGGLSIDANGFPTLLGDMCTVPGIDAVGNYVDFVFMVGDPSDGLGFITVDEFGLMKMGSFENNFFPKDNTKIEFLNVNSYRYSQNPTWVTSGETTYGNYLLYASYSDGEDDAINMGYVRIGASDPDNPENVTTEFQLSLQATGTIDVDLLSGKGEDHTVTDIVRLPDEGLVLLFIKTGLSSVDDWIVKYNPYSNEIVWKAPVTLPVAARFTYQARADLRGAQEYCWIDGDDRISGVNLATGRVRTIVNDVVADQSLPSTPAGGAVQYYNGQEHSLIYISSGQVNKVYLERTAVGLTSVPTIIAKLFERVGVTKADLGIADVNALNLRGYTLNEVTSIRDVISTLRQIYTFDVIESNGRLRYVARGGSAVATIENKYLQDIEGEGGYLPFEHGIDIAELRKIDITYRDIDREYMDNLQNIYYPPVESVGFDEDAGIQVTTPVVLTANEARYIADKLLYSKRINEVKLRAVVPFRFAWLDPGDIVNVNIDTAGTDQVQCRITRQTITRDMNVELELVRDDVDIYNDDPGFGGVIGRFWRIRFPPLDPLYRVHYLPIPDVDVNTSISFAQQSRFLGKMWFCLLDLLRTSSDVSNTAQLTVDILSYQSWQQRVDAFYNPPAGVTYSDAILSEPSWKTPQKIPTWGFLTQVPGGATSPHTPDENNSLTIRVMHERTGFTFQSYSTYAADGQWYSAWSAVNAPSGVSYYSSDVGLQSNSENPLTGNMLVCGGEIIRFREVTDNGDGTYTLTGLLRGVNNTDYYSRFLSAGEICILVRNRAGTLDNEALNYFWTDQYSFDDALNTARYYHKIGANWTEDVAPLKTAQIALVSNNPRQTNPYFTVAPWTVISPAGHNITANYDGSGNVDIAWSRRSPYVRAQNIYDDITPTSNTLDPGLWNEYPDDGDEAAQFTVWGGFNHSDFYIVLASADLGDQFQNSAQAGYLREVFVDNATTYEYTAAQQTEDGFDRTTDTLYMYIWARHPAFGDGFRMLKPHKLKPL